MSTRRKRGQSGVGLPDQGVSQVMDNSSLSFTVGRANLLNIRPQSAVLPKQAKHISHVRSAREGSRPRTAPSVKLLEDLRSETPHNLSTLTQQKGLKKSHLKPVPRDSKSFGGFHTSAIQNGEYMQGEDSLGTGQVHQSLHSLYRGPQLKKPGHTQGLKVTRKKQAWTETVEQTTTQPTNLKLQKGTLCKQESFSKWIAGPDVDSDEYDTDLEDDFPKSPDKPIDPTGKFKYEEECHKLGVVPVSYIARHLGDRHLRMRHHYLGGRRTIPIAEALKRNTVTESLDLSDNYIEGSGAYVITDMVNSNLFIVSLNLSNNFLKSDGAKAIAEMLEMNTTLKSLSLSGNQLSDYDCHLFVEALKNNLSLTSLDLSHNEISDLGASWLASALGINEGLTDLDISWNAIRQKGAKAFGNALLKNCVLEVLDLSWNGLGMHGAAGLAKGLKGNSKLKVLDLSNNRMDSKAMDKFCPGFSRNSGLETLVVNMNPITEEGLDRLLKASSSHPALKFLSVEEVVVTPAIYAKIQELQEKKKLIIVHGDVGGYQRFSAHYSVVKLFQRYLHDNREQLTLTLWQQDKGREGVVTVEELNHAFREAGFRLTNKQQEMLIEAGKLQRNGYIEYSGLLDGSISSVFKS